MNVTPGNDDVRSRILARLAAIAPDIDPATIDPRRDLRDQVDFDSMDRLHFAIAVAEEFGIDIPETDYRELGALDGACAYVRGRLAQRRAP